MFPPRRRVCAWLVLSDVLSDIDEGSCRSLPGTFSRSAHGYSASHVRADPGTGCSVSAPPCTPSRAVKVPAVKERFAWLCLGFYFHSARDASFPCCLETEPLISSPDQHDLFLRTKRTGGGRKSFCIKRTFWQNSAMNCSAQLEPRWGVRGLLRRRFCVRAFA
jgi:hypothetical protein